MQNHAPHTRAEKRSFFHELREFFFATEVPYGLALLRILLPLIVLIDVVRRWPFARELFSADGASAPLAEAYGYLGLLPEFSGSITVALFSLLAFSLVTSSLGWFTRTSLLITTVLYAYFGMQDSVSSITKYVVIASHIFLLLSISRCGDIWSIDAWLAGRKPRTAPPGGSWNQQPASAVWPRRLIQLLIGISYFGAAATKVHTPAFFTGDQLQYWMMTYIYYSQPLGDYLAHYPLISILSAYVTLFWEILFVVIAWRGRGRIWMLGLGVLFHLGTVFMLGLIIFPMIMIVSYFSFLNEHDVRRIALAWHRARRRWSAVRRISTLGTSLQQNLALRPGGPSRIAVAAGCFGMLVLTCSAGGAALEYQLDPYGIRHPDGMYTLERIPEEEVRELLRNDTALREKDKFFSFTVGDWAVAGHLINRRDTFRIGERIVVQAAVNPPHEDMWVEVNLHDAEDNQLSRVGQVVARENLRSFVYYQLDNSFEPGEYDLVLKSAGKEITRRTIQLLPAEETAALRAPVAN